MNVLLKKKKKTQHKTNNKTHIVHACWSVAHPSLSWDLRYPKLSDGPISYLRFNDVLIIWVTPLRYDCSLYFGYLYTGSEHTLNTWVLISLLPVKSWYYLVCVCEGEGGPVCKLSLVADEQIIMPWLLAASFPTYEELWFSSGVRNFCIFIYLFRD